MFRHAMIDLETFGLRRGNALRSISVIPFDPFTGFIAAETSRFYQNVDWKSQEAVGLTKDPGTVEWWNKPEQEVAQRLLEPNQDTLTASLMYLDRYLRSNFVPEFRLWARGMMDQEVLEGAYDAIGREKPWHYRAPRDTRAFFDFLETGHVVVDFHPFIGVPHFGPDDAFNECMAINAIFEECGFRRFGVIEDAEFSGYAEVVEDDQTQKFADVADVIAETGMTSAGDKP